MYLRKRCTECCKYTNRLNFAKDPDHFDGLARVCNKCLEEKEDDNEDIKITEDKFIEAIIENVESKIIQQIDKKTGGVVAEYETPILAGEGIKRDPTSIRNVIKGRSKSAYGFFWKYKTI